VLLHFIRYARCAKCGREARVYGTELNHKTLFGGLVLKREELAGTTEDPAQGWKGPRP